MTRLFHIADLHLTAGEDRAYSFSVLHEIVEIANARNVNGLLFCGDMFNSIKDVENCRDEFRKILDGFGGEIFYLPGNHEVLGGTQDQFNRFSFGKARVLNETPFGLFVLGSDPPVEILSFVDPSVTCGYRDWQMGPKRSSVRIAVAHGVVPGTGVWGPKIETDKLVIDSDVFVRFGVDYAALGHIHARPEPMRVDRTVIAYAGSARVYSDGESGPRGGFLLECNQNISYEFVPFSSAGEFRTCELPLSLEGTVTQIPQIEKWNSKDALKIHLTGLVEDEHAIEKLVLELKRDLGPKIRKLKIDSEEIMTLAGVATSLAAKRFLEIWEREKPASDALDYNIWLRARILGLEGLKATLGRSG